MRLQHSFSFFRDAGSPPEDIYLFGRSLNFGFQMGERDRKTGGRKRRLEAIRYSYCIFSGY
jgi:hypothetical protein